LNLRQKHNVYKFILACWAAGALCSCDPSAANSSEGVGKICEIDLTRTSGNLVFTEASTVSYTAPIPADCQQKTTKLTGRAQINLAAQSGVSSSSISLQELSAGQRNLQFDASSDNFLRGTYEKRFDSSFYPDWSYPWADAPTRITLSMSLTDENLTSALPQKVRVELLY